MDTYKITAIKLPKTIKKKRLNMGGVKGTSGFSTCRRKLIAFWVGAEDFDG